MCDMWVLYMLWYVSELSREYEMTISLYNAIPIIKLILVSSAIYYCYPSDHQQRLYGILRIVRKRNIVNTFQAYIRNRRVVRVNAVWRTNIKFDFFLAQIVYKIQYAERLKINKYLYWFWFLHKNKLFKELKWNGDFNGINRQIILIFVFVNLKKLSIVKTLKEIFLSWYLLLLLLLLCVCVKLSRNILIYNVTIENKTVGSDTSLLPTALV